jgi:Uma2 family endonuclease
VLQWPDNKIELNEFSEPQPHISLVKYRADFYASGHPTPEDILVAIEVADTTAEQDRQVKILSYARAGIQEVWLVDLPNDRIEVQASPASGIYQEVRIVLRGQNVLSPAFPNLKLKADAALG